MANEAPKQGQKETSTREAAKSGRQGLKGQGENYVRRRAKGSFNRGLFALACLCVLALAAFLGSGAPSAGAAESFPGQGFLPDNRAWEMVSPPDKSGGNVAANTARTHAAADGNAATFASTVAFGDARGINTAAEYMARRDAAPGTNGWSTHAITPTQRSFPIYAGFVQVLAPGYAGDFSADLSRGVFLSQRPLTEDPSAAYANNLYLRSDMSTPGQGSYGLLTDSLAPASSFSASELLSQGQPFFAGASTDFSHVIFETHLGLTEEGPSAPQLGKVKLYENAGGTVRVVGRVPVEPATSCDDAGPPTMQCVQAESSQAGISARQYSARMISADGSRILFNLFQPPTPTGRILDANIYMREDGTKTFQINASETDPPAPPSPSGEAELWDASRDGSRVFFTTNEPLLDEDEDGGKTDLYMYEVDKPEGERLTLLSVDNQPPDDGVASSVIGASDDGHYVYFVSDGQLTPEAPAGVNQGLYLWHDGQISYLGQFEDTLLAQRNTPRSGWDNAPQSKTSRVTPDGRRLLFMTTSDEGFKGIGGFGGYDHGANPPTCNYGGAGPCRELYTYDADTGRLRCASCNPTGATATANALTDVKADLGPIAETPHLSHALSDDGRYVFFSTAERLVPEDTNGVSDAYEYDTVTEEPHLLSSGQDKGPSYFMDASADGKDAFIATSERLSGWDVDTSVDLYDARVGGGLPEPVPPPPSCQGDACQPNPTRLNDPTPSSSSFKGAGNQKARKHHKHKRRGKHRHKRDAKSNRRAGR